MPGYVEQAVLFGPFTLYRSSKLLLEADREVRLGDRTLDLLIALVERSGEVVSKQSLISYVWGDDGVEETTLRAHIASLRTVLGEGESGQRYIVNVAGRGYCFVAIPHFQRNASAQSVEPSRIAPSQHNLPRPLTRVIGREKIIEATASQLEQRRFICIAGSAGMGKTTVALAIAEQLLTHYRDGVRFVDLSLIWEPNLVATALASALDLVVAPEDGVASLARSLSQKSMLIVLDNCEHVAEAAAEVAVSLLKVAPNVNLLATSREPLRAEGEWVQRLPPLELPAIGIELTAVEALAFPAVRLFVERSIASVDSFSLTDKDAELACEICRRLDGMPLAIELAAARMAAFGIKGLMRALDDRLTILTSRQRTGLARHRTLAALLDWSHEILPEPERIVLRRLSVFRGSFSLDSAQAVASGAGIEARQVVEAVASLASKSLIGADFRQKDVQYRLLETTRDYAYDKLKESGEASPTHLLHARRICALLEASASLEQTLARSGWIAAYACLIGDTRAALDWALADGGDTLVGIRLAVATIPLCDHLSLVEEFRDRVATAVKRVREIEPPDSLLEMRVNIVFAALSYQTKGPSDAVTAATDRVLELSELPALSGHLDEAIHAAWACAFAHGNYPQSMKYANALAAVSLSSPKPALSLVVDRIRAQSLLFLGDLKTSEMLAERVISHPTQVTRLSAVQPLVLNRKVSMRIVLTRIHWLLGRPEKAANLAKQCVELASADVAYGLCQALAFVACPIALWMDDRASARAYSERLVQHSVDRNVRYWQRWGNNFLLVLSAREASEKLGSRVTPFDLDIDSVDKKQWDLFATFGCFDGNAQLVERAEQNLGGWCAAELLRRHGELMLQQDPGDTDAARERFERALAVSHAQGALSWELRAATSLSRLMSEQGQMAQARDLLGAVYARFSEGFGSSDLVKAKLMLDAFRA